MKTRRLLIFLMLFTPALLVGNGVKAQNYNVLNECVALSPLLDDIHACLDNYLDVMDGNIADITNYLAGMLSGESLAGLNRSQQAFVEYRRQNCLWYLDFSSPRSEAEQIAKNCLASMSLHRLQELQALVSIEDSSGQTLRGFYVYGADRNSFQPCGSDDRYWVEGDFSLVSRVQQTYLSISTSELQVLHAEFAGSIDKELQAPIGHNGILLLDNLLGMRVPKESDCRLPGDSGSDFSPLTPSVNTLLETEPGANDEVPTDQDEPQQQLIAYFGDWLVDCTENDDVRACTLQVSFNNDETDTTTSVTNVPATLLINRQKQEATTLEIRFPNREIESPALIRWKVDGRVFADLVGSENRVDERGTRHLIKDNRYLRDGLLPMMIKGIELTIEILNSDGDESGDQLQATLKGLTRALEFADAFVREES